MFGIQKVVGTWGELALGPLLLIIGLFMLVGDRLNLPQFGFSGNAEGLAKRGGWGANESCPAFTGKVGKRLHIGFDDPSHATGTPEFIEAEFRRVRDEIRERFHSFYLSELCRK